ncbi:MAG: hypothetical protein ACI4GZ_00465 [Ruminococcus sp.]
MDTFCEQVVKRGSGVKEKLISVLLIAAFSVVELLFILIFMVVPEVFWIMVALIVAITAIVTLSIVIPRINNVEFDYSVIGNVLCIDKIINQRSRKKALRIEIGNIEAMGEIKNGEIPQDRYAKKKDYSDAGKDGKYYCVYRESGKGKCLLVFSPNQKIIDGMRPSMNRDLVLKLFYKR